MAELERKKITERTKDCVAKIKHDSGKYMGRRSTLPDPTVQPIVKSHSWASQ